jgi:hypothetical protein
MPAAFPQPRDLNCWTRLGKTLTDAPALSSDQAEELDRRIAA